MIVMETLKDLVKNGNFEEIRNAFLLQLFASLIGGICVGFVLSRAIS
jgi:hypothetical protein